MCEKLDENLIFRIASDDKQALETLYLETKTAVYGFILSIVRNFHTAEEIMQETYIKVYISAPSYVAQGKPLAWIFTISRNIALMRLRERESSNVPLNLEFLSAQSDNTLEQTLDYLVLETALRILKDEERQIVMLHDVSGMKHREIADILQIPLPTVLSKYRRSLSKLRKHIKEDM
jgi:RNA polymerase sigma factor, sigma-70 family